MTEFKKGSTLNGKRHTASTNKIYETDIAEAIKFDYPDRASRCRNLMVNPQTGDIYIVSKRLSGAATSL